MIRLTGRGITKRYGATRALDGLDLDIVSGEIVGIAGPNGSGKSTLTRMLAGEEKADGGEIVLTRSGAAVDEVWRHVAVVHQEPHIWPNMTVEQNLAVGREGRWFGGITPEPVAANAVLHRLGIASFAHHELADLSLAVQQRVEIARAMLSNADVFLFDEPNSALTEDESKALFTTMAELAQSGKIVLLITHRLNDFVRCCDRILVLRDGHIRCEIKGKDITETSIAAQLTPKDVPGKAPQAPSDRAAQSPMRAPRSSGLTGVPTGSARSMTFRSNFCLGAFSSCRASKALVHGNSFRRLALFVRYTAWTGRASARSARRPSPISRPADGIRSFQI